jgi:DnaA family protein
MIAEQLSLNVQLRDDASFDAFLPARNEALVHALKSFSEAPDLQIFIRGEPESGKTHLLQAVCHEASDRGVHASYLPLKDVATYGPGIFEGLEAIEMVCVDDLEMLAGQPELERALFNMINSQRERGHHLLLSAPAAPDQLNISLPDLVSRLQWGGVFRLIPPDDEEKVLVLQLRAAQRGLEMTEEVARYLLKNIPRGLNGMMSVLEQLDHASLREQRRLTIPFVRATLGYS